jgi:hypothetical protein
MPRLSSLPAALAAVIVLALAPAALAQTPRPQNNEIQFDLDATFMSPNNASRIAIVYTWLPGAINARDEVVPALRRFVRQPTELYAGAVRTTDTFDNVTGALVGGRFAPLGGRFYGLAELGIDYDTIENDPYEQEEAYIGGSARLEVGGRVLPLLQLGAAYSARSVLKAMPKSTLTGLRAERDGGAQDFDAVLTFSTPDDRLLLSAAVGWRDVDWTFAGPAPGQAIASGPHASLRGSLQLDFQTSILFRAFYSREDWENTRTVASPDPETPDFSDYLAKEFRAPNKPEGRVNVVEVELGLLYWFEARWGFRVSLGGGYSDAMPLVDSRDTPRFKAGVGFVSRY